MLTTLINPVVVTLQLVQSKNIYSYPQYTEVLAVDAGENELAKFTIMPISQSQLKIFMEGGNNIYEYTINREDYQGITEPMKIMLSKINLTL